MSLLTLDAMQRAQAVCSDFSPYPHSAIAHPALVMGEGGLGGQRVYVLAQDPSVEGGSFGQHESDEVAVWLIRVIAHPAPLILFLDSGGARMSEGLAALGGFRRLFRALSRLWIAGVPIIAVCGKTVFGGASMLACVADTRIFFERSLLGMSGPRIVQAIAGAADFDATNKALLSETMGGAARAAREQGICIADVGVALQSTLLHVLREVAQKNVSRQFEDTLIAQRQRLERDGLTRPPKLVPFTCDCPVSIRSALVDDGVLIGRTQDDGFLYGIVNQKWADAWDAWKLANAMFAQWETAPNMPAHILLDCPAHATSRALEAGMVSQYFTLLGLAARALHARGATVTLHIVGEAAGGVHVALAGGASRVIAYPHAHIRILPRIAIDQVRSDVLEVTDTPQTWLHTGVTDQLA